MTVQLPVLLWTVICFGALVLILNNLLFKPMLTFMDRRNERIRLAAEKKAENERALREAEEAVLRFREEQKAHTAALSEKALADAQKDADRMLSDAVRRGKEDTEALRLRLEREREEIGQTLSGDADTLAEAWLTALTGGKRPD